MSTNLSLPNLLMTPKAAPPSSSATTAGPAAPNRGAEERTPSFKQSLQQVESKPADRRPAEPASNTARTKEATTSASSNSSAKTPATAADSSSSAAEEAVGETPTSFLQTLGLRQSAATASSGLSYLARLAAAGTTEEPVDPEAAALGIEVAASLINPATPILSGLDGAAPGAAEGVGGGIATTTLLASMATPGKTRTAESAAMPGAAELALSGKFLPQSLTSADVAIELQPPTASTTGLDALNSQTPVLSKSLIGVTGDFKMLLTEAGIANSALAGGELAASSDAEGQPVLTASALANSPTPSLQLEGRTSIPLNIAFGTAQWSNSLAERTAWMAGQTIHSAEIQLDPPELGPLQVKIQINQDQASVNFVSANPAVREAVEQTMGRLRELFQEQGMELVDSGVADQQPDRQGDRGEAGESGPGSLLAEGDDAAAEPDLHSVVTAAPWGVDYYA